MRLPVRLRISGERSASRQLRNLGALAIAIYTVVIVGIGIIVWLAGQPTWGITPDPHGPIACEQGSCMVWRITSTYGGETFSHKVSVDMYVCAADGQTITTTVSSDKIDHAHTLIIADRPVCSSTQMESLTSDIVPFPDAFIALMIATICGVLAALICRHATHRHLVGPVIAPLVSLVIAFAWLPGSINQPLIYLLESVAASNLCPVFLYTAMGRILLPSPIGIIQRLWASTFPVVNIIGGSCFFITMVSFVFQGSSLYWNSHLFLDLILLVTIPLMTISLILYRNISVQQGQERIYARILGGGILVALIPLLIFGVIPALFPVHFIIGAYEAIITFLAIPLTLAYVILRRDLLQVDTRIYRATGIIVGTLTVALALAVVLSIIEQITHLPPGSLTLIVGSLALLAIATPFLFQGGRWLTERWLFPDLLRYRHLLAHDPDHAGSLSSVAIGEAMIGEIILAFPVKMAAFLVLDQPRQTFIAVAQTPLTSEDEHEPCCLPIMHPLIQQLEQGKIVQPAEGVSDPWRLGIPVRLQQQLIAFLLLGPRTDGDPFSDTEQQTIASLVARQALALDYARVADLLRASREDVARAHQQSLLSRERERRAVAQDLHDGAIQQLIGISYHVTQARQQVPSERIAEVAYLDTIRHDIVQVVSQLRSLVSDLRPPGLEELGLVATLEGYVAHLQREQTPGMPTITLQVETQDTEPPEEIALCLMRVSQEVVRNAVRHAQAHHISIILCLLEKEATLHIEDDGQGFVVPTPVSELTRAGHYGLVGITERVNWVGGHLTIASNPGDGTQISVRIPYIS
jgi:signal transduction histidine kinase